MTSSDTQKIESRITAGVVERNLDLVRFRREQDIIIRFRGEQVRVPRKMLSLEEDEGFYDIATGLVTFTFFADSVESVSAENGDDRDL